MSCSCTSPPCTSSVPTTHSGSSRRVRRTRCRSIPTTRQRQRRHLRVSDHLGRVRVLRAEHVRRSEQLHRGQPAADARRTSCRSGPPPVLRDPALGAEQASGRLHDVRLAAGVADPAMARYLPRAQLPLSGRPIAGSFSSGWCRPVVLGVCGANKPEGIWVILSAFRRSTITRLPGDHGRSSESWSVRCRCRRASRRRSPAIRWKLQAVAGLARWSYTDAHATYFPAPALAGAPPAGAVDGRTAGHRPGGGDSAPVWSFGGLFGTRDIASAQRGFQVYSEVCSNCHAMHQVHFRDLSGIGLTEMRSRRWLRHSPCLKDGRPGPTEGRARYAGQSVPLAIPE